MYDFQFNGVLLIFSLGVLIMHNAFENNDKNSYVILKHIFSHVILLCKVSQFFNTCFNVKSYKF